MVRKSDDVTLASLHRVAESIKSHKDDTAKEVLCPIFLHVFSRGMTRCIIFSPLHILDVAIVLSISSNRRTLAMRISFHRSDVVDSIITRVSLSCLGDRPGKIKKRSRKLRVVHISRFGSRSALRRQLYIVLPQSTYHLFRAPDIKIIVHNGCHHRKDSTR